MRICKKCLLHILSNLMLAAIVWAVIESFITAANYYFIIPAILAILIKSWADKNLEDKWQN